MQLSRPPADCFYTVKFQSSSGQKAGCNPKVSVASEDAAGFNPHPAFWPDAIHPQASSDTYYDAFQSSSGQKAGCNCHGASSSSNEYRVSILIRPEGRMQLRAPWGAKPAIRVSILIRPEGRMQSYRRAGRSPNAASFNPHPARRPDAIGSEGRYIDENDSFNPHPARRPDAIGVSTVPPSQAFCFNPHPARRPDAIYWQRGSLRR